MVTRMDTDRISRRSLNNLSVRLSEIGQRQEALVAINECVALYRQLYDGHPDGYRSDLARSLNNLSLRLSEIGQRQEALVAINECVALRRQLYDGHPDGYRSDLAAVAQ